MRVLVAGAGVGGLAVARGLAAAGHHVRVFEQADGPRTSGGALTLWSNGAGIAAELGVPLDGEGAPVDALVQYAFDGRRLLRLDAAPAIRRYGRQHVCLPRWRLIRLLADGLPDGTVSFEKVCTGLAYDGDGARLDFSDGSSETGDVLVGADGRHSAVRRALWGRDPGGPVRGPAHAQGADQALEDAWALVPALRNTADLPSALRRYERERSRRAARIALASGTEYVNRYLPVLSRLVPDRLTGPAYTWWLRHISGYLSDLPR